jgi:hypothetical protein
MHLKLKELFGVSHINIDFDNKNIDINDETVE